MRSLIRRSLHDCDGTAMLEFALTFPLLIVVMLGLIECGQAFWAQNALHYAVEQTARCMSLGTTTCSATTAAAMSGYGFAPSVFTLSPDVACGTGSINGDSVSGSYPFQFNIFGFTHTVTLTAQSCFPHITS